MKARGREAGQDDWPIHRSWTWKCTVPVGVWAKHEGGRATHTVERTNLPRSECAPSLATARRVFDWPARYSIRDSLVAAYTHAGLWPIDDRFGTCYTGAQSLLKAICKFCMSIGPINMTHVAR